MKRAAILALPLAAMLLAGCSPQPSRDDVAERFLIELSDSETIRAGMTDLADGIAGDALDGRCGDTEYEAGLQSNGDADLFYAWRSTCLMYFEGDLTAAQVDETKQMIADRAATS